MHTNLTMQTERRKRTLARILTALVMTGIAASASASVDPDQSTLTAPAGDGWQVLSSVRLANASPVAAGAAASAPTAASAALPSAPTTASAAAATGPTAAAAGSLAVAQVVVPGAETPATLTLSISPQDINLRNALDRWLQTQGWQLAWKIDDDLPLEFNATFSGDFTSVLTQVMQATNHMRTPTRICRHTNHVIRVIARAATCKD